MPTYLYETIEDDGSSKPQRFEQVQRMSDSALTHHPDTGQPVRRIVTGGIGLKLGVLRRSTVVNKKSPAATACGCATGRPHRHTSGCKH